MLPLLSQSTRRHLPSIGPYYRRSLFSLPTLPSIPGFESKRQNYHEEKIFHYNEKELYAIVADVASYPQFIPFCTGSRIASFALERAMQEKTEVDAELSVGFLSFKESYVSRVTYVPFKSVQAVASSSTPLFKTLSTTWSFQSTAPTSLTTSAGGYMSDAPGPTLVSFDLTYEFSNPLHAGVSSAFFGQISKLMIAAFADRCQSIYGPRT
ncbi:hypothetical protein M413DRAFT_64768 [Hebeloma cylindrosporum]|uniref:Coenzyme Q-binding protein COQ10 START domain-containing protein n=1 Tax=Hebeloma cylindrosporum TaxID=76867 RepID=A0A0C2YZ22_HEBCY|nr:hypothetical protein M413DRAFT_64768 [Hebeloma cylindrosporum h7]